MDFKIIINSGLYGTFNWQAYFINDQMDEFASIGGGVETTNDEAIEAAKYRIESFANHNGVVVNNIEIT